MADASQHILVTGGAGFIGSHTVDHLLALGHAVTVLDDLSTGRRENLQAHESTARFRFVHGDVTEPLPPDLDLAALGPVTHVLHLAAQVSVQRSLLDPLGDMHTNLGGTLRILAWARARHVTRFVFASSAAVYGEVALPADESAPCAPLSPYGLHKLASEQHLALAAGAVDSASCRFFNVYGPRQVPGSEYAGVIAIFLARAAAGAPITIYGDGSSTRDFVYVGDVARALATVLFAPDRLAGRAMNIGTGHETSIAELARAAAATGDASIAHAPARVGDIERSVASIARITTLGWTAQVALADGLRATAAWIAATEGSRKRSGP